MAANDREELLGVATALAAGDLAGQTHNDYYTPGDADCKNIARAAVKRAAFLITKVDSVIDAFTDAVPDEGEDTDVRSESDDQS